MAVSKRLRYEILRRDHFACRYCGAKAPDALLRVDHVIPVSLGGPDSPTNLVTACRDCNAGKTSSMPNAAPVADVLQDTFRRAAALKQVTEPDTENPEELAIEAALLLWGQEWVHTSKSGPTAEQVTEFRATAREAISSGTATYELIEAAPYGAWFTTSDAREAVEHLGQSKKFNERYAAQSIFSHAWYYVHGEEPAREITDRLWDDCEKLYELDIHPIWVSLAAAAAGLHGTARMHVGLPVEGLNAIGAIPGLLYAEDAWAASWLNTSPALSLPSDSDREAFRASLKHVCATGQYSLRDIYAAATTAGVYHDTSLELHLQCLGSAATAAGLTRPSGEKRGGAVPEG